MELTNREAFFKTKEEVKNKNLEISDNEIFLLIEKVNNYQNYTNLVLNFDKNLANINYFNELKERLFNGEPIQYILNSAPFVDLDIYVDNRVLIPRVETEELVTKTRYFIEKLELEHKVIGDMCTGSGCIALFMKNSFKDSSVFASDISKDALEVANKNAKDLELDIIFLKGDKTKPFVNQNIKFDIFISNPPYVQNKNDIEEKVKKNEPMNAIYSEDGVAFYRDVFQNYKKFMNNKFMMAFEINYDQEHQLTELVEEYFPGDKKYMFLKDIYGLTRFLFILKGYKYDQVD